MAKLGDKTDFSYRVKRVTKVVDGDTIDVILDMGFNILFEQRVRLFGIDTPESRTRDKVEKKYGLKSKKFLLLLLSVNDKENGARKSLGIARNWSDALKLAVTFLRKKDN